MGRIVIAEEKIFPDFVRLGKIEGFVPGLIIGQTSGQKDFIVHLTKTPIPVEKGNKLGTQKKVIEKLSDIEDYWIIDHATQVTRMLPGGMWVLGLFVCGPGDIFSDSVTQSKVSSLIKALTKALGTNPCVFGDSPSTEKLVLHLTSGTNRYVCKSLDVSSSAVQFRSTDCKFLGTLKWHELESHYDFHLNSPYLITSDMEKDSLKTHLLRILEVVSKGVKASLCTIDGEVRNITDNLEISDSKDAKGDRKAKEEKTFHVNLYIPSETDNLGFSTFTVLEELKWTGLLASKVFLHQKATVGEALNAVKEDIIRSFASRITMHCDSLVEEEIGSPEEMMVVHEPPRRVLIPLPHSLVTLSDYLFPGESPSEALTSISELIGVKVTENVLLKDFEGQPDPSDLYDLTTGADTPKHEDSISNPPSHSLFIVSGLIIAILILIVSLIVQFYFK